MVHASSQLVGLGSEPRGVALLQPRQVEQFPFQRWQLLQMREGQKRPVGFGPNQRQQEGNLPLGQLSWKIGDQPRLGSKERVQADFLSRHAGELVRERRFQRFGLGEEDFVHRPVVAREVGDEAIHEKLLPAEAVEHVPPVGNMFASGKIAGDGVEVGNHNTTLTLC